MTQAIAKYAAKKMMSKELDKHKDKAAGGEFDPYYELIQHPRYPNNPNKKKKVKKQIPTYIPDGDAKILAAARKSAYKYDYCLFNLFGLRFGWSSVIGLVPVAGDFLEVFLALLLIRKMTKVDAKLPQSVQFMMLFNIALDFGIGLIPFLGDLADAAYKCNGRNVRLLEKHLDKRYKPRSIQEAESKMKNPPAPATVYEDFSDEDEERRAAFDDRYDDVRQPTRAYSGRRDRVSDEEMGLPRQSTQKSYKEKPSRHGTQSSRRH